MSIGLLLLLIVLSPFIVLYGLVILAKLFESATELLPQAHTAPVVHEMCECGVHSLYTGQSVCSECSRDWTY